MRRRNATKSGAVWRLGLILVLSAVLWPQSLQAEAPIGRFVIGVWSPAGWSGAAKGGVAYHSYDRFFTQSDADSLAELGVNLLVKTPRVGNKDVDDFKAANPGSKKQDAHEILQDLEEAIIDSFKAHGGLIVEQAASELHALGRGVPRSVLFAALQAPGVLSVNLISPATDVAATSVQAAHATSVQVSAA